MRNYGLLTFLLAKLVGFAEKFVYKKVNQYLNYVSGGGRSSLLMLLLFFELHIAPSIYAKENLFFVCRDVDFIETFFLTKSISTYFSTLIHSVESQKVRN